MEQIPKRFKSTADTGAQAKSYVYRRRTQNESLATRWTSLNNQMMDGIEPNCIITLAGRSGSGKSSVANMIEEDILTRNLHHPTAILNFTFEMTGQAQMLRKLSYQMGISTKQLCSVGGRLSDELTEKAFKILDNYAKRDNVFYIEESMTVPQLEKTCMDFQEYNPHKWIIIFIDHAGLVSGYGERDTLMALEKALIRVKKRGRTSIIQLAQLNREIEAPVRKSDVRMHYPNKGDIMGSDSLFQASDYVFIIHRPDALGIDKYGANKVDAAGRLFWHVIKNREGTESVLVFKEHFNANTLEDEGGIDKLF